jgi:hypothetical protein
MHYNGPSERAHTALTIAFNRGLYIAIIMERYEGLQNDLTISLHKGF